MSEVQFEIHCTELLGLTTPKKQEKILSEIQFQESGSEYSSTESGLAVPPVRREI